VGERAGTLGAVGEVGSLTLGRLGRRMRSPGELAAWAARWLAFWIAAYLVAREVGSTIEPRPVVAVVPGLLLVLALISARFPLLVLAVVGAATGLYATIFVTIGIEPHHSVQVPLIGLWIAALHGSLTHRGEFAPRLWPGALLLLLVAGLSLCWVLLADSVSVAAGAWRERYWVMLGALLVAYFPPGRVNSMAIARVLLIAGAVGVGYAVLRWQIGPSNAEHDYALEQAGHYTFLEGKLRPIGGVSDAHALASFLIPLVPLSLALVLNLRDRWRLLAGAVLAGSVLMIVASEVRSGLASAALGAVVVLALVLAARSLGGRRLAAGYLALVLCVGLLGAVATIEADNPTPRSERFLSILNPESDPSFQERRLRWEDALSSVQRQPFGWGFLPAATGHAGDVWHNIGAHDPVNSYLRIAHEQGFLFAVVLVGTLLGILVALVGRSLSSPTSEGSIFAIAGAGALAAFAFQINFESGYVALPTAALAWLIVGLGMRQLSWRRTGAEGPGAP
jgi:O-Antigen ligase